MPYEHLLPEPLRGRNERIDDRIPGSAAAAAEASRESTFLWENE